MTENITQDLIKEQIKRWIEDDSALIKELHEAWDIAINRKEYESAASFCLRITDCKYSKARLAKILELLEQNESLEDK